MNQIFLDILHLALLTLQIILPILSILIGIYFAYNFIRAPYRKNHLVPDEKPRHRFLVIIPARNEETVIGKTISNVQHAKYPAELLDIVVIADNCTDRTAEVARSFGVEVMERHDLTGQSKARALKWAYESQGLLERGHDAVTVLDADSTVIPEYFLFVDRELKNGAQIIHSQIRAANYRHSFIASFISVIYSFSNRFWYLPHANRNRSTIMIGTGCTIRCDHIRKVGWPITTMVEDAEFSIVSMLAGVKVRYCDAAILNVEVPTTLARFWRQLRRWFSGQIECSRRYRAALFRNILHDRQKQGIVLLITMILPYTCTISLIQFLISPLMAYLLSGGQIVPATVLFGYLFNYLAGLAGAILILILDGRIAQPGIWRGIILFPYLSVFYGLVFLTSFIRPKKKWELMQHFSTDQQ